MTARTKLLDEIRRCFGIWSYDLKFNSKVNRLSDHTASEDIAAGLLNLIYGYDLRNANEIHDNHKAIDLVDTDAEGGGGVAVQISASNTIQKARKTIKGFCDASKGDPLSDEYSKLIFLILTADDKFDKWDTLTGDGYTLSILNLTDLSREVEHQDLDRLTQILEYLNRELGMNRRGAADPRDVIGRFARILDKDAVDEAAGKLTPDDVDKFYMVDLNFPVMLRVVSAGRDVPHQKMNDRLLELCRAGTPAILTGNSGTGKSVTMLRTAVTWARSGGIALWVSLDEKTILNDAEAAQFYQNILSIVPDGKEALLCLDNPSLWPNTFDALGRNWPGDPRIRLLLAERSNRLSRMTNAGSDQLRHWFDGAAVAALMQENKKRPLRIKKFPVDYIQEEYQRKHNILKNAVSVMFRKGVIRKVTEKEAVAQLIKDYSKGNVSLVELICQAQFWLKDYATMPENLRMDWDEWKAILRRELGVKKSAQQLYGLIALCSHFEVPISVSLFCRHFHLSETDLTEAIGNWRLQKNVEPVLYCEDTDILPPKHDVIAELFFLLHRETLPVNKLMVELINSMDTRETEKFLEKIVWKGPLQKGEKYPLRDIHYRAYLTAIYDRPETPAFRLFSAARARLALGLLYTVPKKDRKLGQDTLPMAEALDPGLDGSVLTASLYTEWGRLLADLDKKSEAEEKFRAVIAADTKNIHSRTELGRLLARQPGREGEAERFLREAMQIDPKHIQSRTELGRLLARQPGREGEAERFLREAMQIDPKHIQSRTELGRLLAKQPGREDEAERFLREAMQIDPKHIQSRTELGRLLTNQPGREGEAERFLREAIRIDPRNLHPHTELGRLLAKQPGREDEAEQFLREAIRIDPRNLHPHTELGRLLAKQPGREGDAELFLREAMQIDPKHIQSRTELGRLLASQPGREGEAEQFLREAIRIDPRNLHPHTELGRLLATQPGREGEAERFLREIISIDARNCHARVELAKLFSRTGRTAEAEQLYREVLQIDPRNVFAGSGLRNLRP